MGTPSVSAKDLAGMIEEVAARLARGKDPDFPTRLRLFLDNPMLYGPIPPPDPEIRERNEERQELYKWMQGVYDDLGIECKVPYPPILTPKQWKSMKKYGFRLFYIPNFDSPPSDFVGFDRWRISHVDVSYESCPLRAGWVAVETIAKPNYTDKLGYLNDVLGATLKLPGRFNKTIPELCGKDGILQRVAKVTGFPQKATRLPTAEEWNFLANLFRWLNAHQKAGLPNFGHTNTSEWAANTFTSFKSLGADAHLTVGSGGIAYVDKAYSNHPWVNIGFRVLVEL